MPTLTPEQKKQMIREALGLDKAFSGASGASGTPNDVEAEIKRLEALTAPKPEREGALKTLVKGLGTGIARAGVTAYNFSSGLVDLAGAAGRKLAGDDEGAQEFINQAAKDTKAKRTLPIFGELDPVGNTGNLRSDIKDIIGTGLDVGSVVVGGGAGGQALKTTLKESVKQGTKAGLRYGSLFGGASEGGKALQEDKGALDVLKDTAKGVVGGAVFGGALGAGGAALGAAAGSASRAGKTAIENIIEKYSPTLKTVKNVGKGLAEKAKEGVRKTQGFADRVEINAAEKQAARLEFDALPAQIKDAATKGVLPRDAQLIAGATPTEKKLMSSLRDTAEAFEKDRMSTPPSELFGQEFSKRVTALKDEVEKAVSTLDEIVRKSGNKKLDTGATADNIIQSMQSVKGLEGIKFKADGTLDFSGTTLSSSLTKSERKALNSALKDALRRKDTFNAHKYRQELFEELGGRTRAGIKTTDTADAGLEAIRKGLSKSIGGVAKGYEDANQKVAELLGIKKQIQNIFGNSKKGSQDIFNLKAGVLLRRLTSNAKSGQDIAGIIRDLETVLEGKGIKFDTSLLKVQEFINLLNRYYDVAGDTSLQGILRSTDIPSGGKDLISKVINEITEISKATPETGREAIKNLLRAEKNK